MNPIQEHTIVDVVNAIRDVDENARIDVDVEYENEGYYEEAYAPYLVIRATGTGLMDVHLDIEDYENLITHTPEHIELRIDY